MSDSAFTTDQREREASGAHAYGRYLEEFEVGAVYKHWPAKTVTEADIAAFAGVSDGYFATMRIPIKAGRGFTTADRDSSASVIVISEAKHSGTDSASPARIGSVRPGPR